MSVRGYVELCGDGATLALIEGEPDADGSAVAAARRNAPLAAVHAGRRHLLDPSGEAKLAALDVRPETRGGLHERTTWFDGALLQLGGGLGSCKT